jgi:uncharacterized membrane protein YeaQ/YmgE (transglycosylase-associated protein family)
MANQPVHGQKNEEAIMKSNLDMQAIVMMLVIGLIAGFLASLIVGGGGVLRYLVTGVIGSFIGGVALNAAGVNLGINNAIASQIATSTIGAIIVVILARIVA